MITLTDLFSGAGNASSGAGESGVEVQFAIDIDPYALTIHEIEHPDTNHILADITNIEPKRIPRTDFAWVSSPCIHHGSTRGKRDMSAEAHMSRDLMWEACRFAESRRYQAIVIENVVGVRAWPSWKIWNVYLEGLGYHVQHLSVNAAHCAVTGDSLPQSRDRLYTVASRSKVDFSPILTPSAYCLSCMREVPTTRMNATRSQGLGRYGFSYIYLCQDCGKRVIPHERPVSGILDMDRETVPVRPTLAASTLHRIASGLRNFEGDPFIAELRGGGSSARSLQSPLSSVTAGGSHHMLVIPGDEARYRMLDASELARAQGFGDISAWPGQAQEKRRVIGNAVPSNVARDIFSLLTS